MNRVAVVFEYATLNGGERSMLAAVDRLDAGAWQIVALAPASGPLAAALRTRGIEHVPLRLRDAAGARLPREAACRQLLTAIDAAAPDLVHANSLSMGRLTGAIADRLTVPAFAHLRDILKLSRAAVADLNRNRQLIAVSRAAHEFHVAQGLDAGRTCVLHNGVDCSEFQPRPASGRLRGELGLDESAFLVVAIGQIGLRKGQDVLARAALLAAERLPQVHYLLVGKRHSAKRESVEFERAIVEQFDGAGLGDRLHRLGYRDDVAWIMNEADLLVHPAHQEPLGRVLLEAAASGLPIVATNVGGTGEIVEGGRSARLIPAGDPPALAAAMTEMSADSSLRARMAASARQRMLESFRAEDAARNLCRAWEKGRKMMNDE